MRVRPYPPIETIILAWYCDGCALPVENGAGWIEVSYRDLNYAQERDARVRANLRAKDQSGMPLTHEDLADLPDPVRWMAWHQQCAPEGAEQKQQRSAYRMPISRVRNLAQLLDLHGEVSRKTWHVFTDFVDLRVFLTQPDTIPGPTLVPSPTAVTGHTHPHGLVSVRS